ncbi:MAG: PQQ-binding-like beta-propeller repeat protein [Pirellulaceae bacterium]|nr:PQQ-binding-like beta-propeller repeat protein [Pirellulaceae bacterium]
MNQTISCLLSPPTNESSPSRSLHRLLIFVLATIPTATDVSANDTWPTFRNNGTGTATATGIPTRWSPEAGVAWRSAIPGYGQSAPVVWKDTIFVTSSDGPFQERCYVHAFELQSGKKRWSSPIQATTKVENYFRNSRAAPTCVVDADRVISFFASGDVTAMNHDGETLWSVPLFQDFGHVDNERGTASSPAQNNEHVFIVIDHHGPSYIVAIRKRDGEIAWKTDRGDRVPSWSSPLVTTRDGQQIVVISSSDTVNAYNADDGQLLWQVDGIQGNHIPSATVADDSIYVGSTEMYGGNASAEEVAGSNCRIDLLSAQSTPRYKVRWGAERANSYYSTPLAFAGYVYYVNKAGVLYCVDQESGEQHFAKRIGNPCWASAIGVENPSGEQLVYLVQKNGVTVVLRPGDTFDQVARNQLWDRDQMIEAAENAATLRKQNSVPPDQAKPKTGPEKVFGSMPETALHRMFSYDDPSAYSAVVVDGSLLIRSGQHLYCVRQR